MKKLENTTGVRKQALYDQDFIQEAYTEALAGIATNLQNGYTFIVLHGCVITSDLLGTSTTAGAIAYNGEIYQVLAQTLVTGSPVNWKIKSTATQCLYRDGLKDTYFTNILELSTSAGIGAVADTKYLKDILPPVHTNATATKVLKSVDNKTVYQNMIEKYKRDTGVYVQASLDPYDIVIATLPNDSKKRILQINIAVTLQENPAFNVIREYAVNLYIGPTLRTYGESGTPNTGWESLCISLGHNTEPITCTGQTVKATLVLNAEAVVASTTFTYYYDITSILQDTIDTF